MEVLDRFGIGVHVRVEGASELPVHGADGFLVRASGDAENGVRVHAGMIILGMRRKQGAHAGKLGFGRTGFGRVLGRLLQLASHSSTFPPASRPRNPPRRIVWRQVTRSADYRTSRSTRTAMRSASATRTCGSRCG